jgi:immune inhibitor A
LIWKWDTSQTDDNTSAHPGAGLILPVDAHSKALKWADGTLLRNKMQTFDSTFSTYATDAFTLHNADVKLKVKSKKGVSVFDDRKGSYYDPANPFGSVKVTDTNTKIKIVKEPKDGSTITVQVGRSTK